jgi:eukaryotic-like serine/threonine-protein kinase
VVERGSLTQSPERSPMIGSRGESNTDTIEGTSGGCGDGQRDATPVRGSTVGRYVILNELGAGAMGVVHVAYDPKLDRNVAVKLLRAGHGSVQSRLLREAQAMAKLSHPNIVAVHDVGTTGERVWIAMELVAGKTLGAWIREAPRPWGELLEVMLAAGRGLAHAHAAGLVHRDFKPDNVMVGDDGRVRVMDFGLARPTDEAGPAVSGDERASTDDDERPGVVGETTEAASAVSRTGALIGTPAYMAPEQFAGERAGVAADQFAFCITLWEAVYKERPFAGDTIATIAKHVLDGSRRAPRRDGSGPTWMRAAIERGLARDASERWPSMQALLDVLERGKARARRRRAVTGMGALALVGAVAAGVHALDVHRRTEACHASGERIAADWNDEVRAEIRAVMLATEVSHAENTAVRVVRWLDDHAAAWQEATTEACLDANVRGVWDLDLLDRAQWCLDGPRLALQSLVQRLANADSSAMASAAPVAASLPMVGRCRDAALLQRLPPPPVKRRKEAERIRAEVTRAEAVADAGMYEEGLDMVRAAAQRADALGWPPLVALTRAKEAKLHDLVGDYAAAERIGSEAYHQAARAGAWDIAASVGIALVMTVGERQARTSEGLAWARHAEDALVHAGTSHGLQEAQRLASIATVRRLAGEYARARDLQERALEIQEANYGPDHPVVASTLHNLGNTLDDLGDRQGARRMFERALAAKEEAFGPDHPIVSSTVSSLGFLDHFAGDTQSARRLMERALAINEGAFGSDHPTVAADLYNLGATYDVDEDGDTARAYFERALSIRRATLGTEHPEIATNMLALSVIHRERGDHEEAMRLAKAALAIQEKVSSPDHLDVANTLRVMAQLHHNLGDVDGWHERLENAVAIYDRHDGVQPLESLTRYELAEALVATGRDRGRARALAEQALDGLRDGGLTDEVLRETLEAWLRDNPP